MFFRLAKQTAECDGATEQLKADNQKELVTQMNIILNSVTEIINTEIIFMV